VTDPRRATSESGAREAHAMSGSSGVVESSAAARPAPRPRGRGLARALALALALAALVALGRAAGGAIPRFAQWVDGLGAWGPAVFVAGYVAAVVAFAPAWPLTVAAGAIFGVARGTLYAFVAASLGACLAFLLARHGARGLVERRIAGDARFAAIDRAIGQQGRRIVLLLRLSPAFPFNLLNYALGLTRVRFADYAAACVGMLPGTLAYVYSGSLLGDVAAAAGGAPPERGPAQQALFAAGLAATIAVTVVVTRLARRALAEATAGESRA
jgi:uncharacterized membrane protein YdjX (TVP38/TMEM64 family)